MTLVIPGVRALTHVETNLAVSGQPLSAWHVAALGALRWDRTPDLRP